MNSASKLLATRYARALFQAARDASDTGAGEEVLGEVSMARGLMREFSPLFYSPRLSVKEKSAKLASVLKGKVSPLTERFLVLLIERKRFQLLGEIEDALEKTILDSKGIVKAQIHSAAPLPAALRERIGSRLSKIFSREVLMEVKEEPDLLGGVRIRVGDFVIDASLKGRLKALSQTLIGESL